MGPPTILAHRRVLRRLGPPLDGGDRGMAPAILQDIFPPLIAPGVPCDRHLTDIWVTIRAICRQVLGKNRDQRFPFIHTVWMIFVNPVYLGKVAFFDVLSGRIWGEAVSWHRAEDSGKPWVKGDCMVAVLGFAIGDWQDRGTKGFSHGGTEIYYHRVQRVERGLSVL